MDHAKSTAQNFDYLYEMYRHREYFKEEGETLVVNVVDECDQIDEIYNPVRVRLLVRSNCRTCNKVLFRLASRFVEISPYQLKVLFSSGLQSAELVRHETVEQSVHYFLLSDDHDMEAIELGWQCWKCARLPGGGLSRRLEK